MTSWKLGELRDAIKQIKVADMCAVLKVIRSISNADEIFNYHYATAKNTVARHHSLTDQASPEMILRALGGGENAAQYAADRLVHQAHCISAALTLRAMYDMFAQLVRELLLPCKKSDKHWSIEKTYKSLDESKLRKAIKKTVSKCEDYNYLRAFTNVSKHQFNVGHVTHIDFEDDRAGIRFRSFRYGQQEFSPYWSEEFLELLFRVRSNFISCGNVLSKELQSNSLIGRGRDTGFHTATS